MFNQGNDRQRLLLILGLFFFFLWLLNEFYEERSPRPKRDRLKLLKCSGRLLFQDPWVPAWAFGMPFAVLALTGALMLMASKVTAPSNKLALSLETLAIGLGTAAGFYLSGLALALAIMGVTVKRLQGGRPGLAEGWEAVRLNLGAAWKGSLRELSSVMSGKKKVAPGDGLTELLVLPVMLADGLSWDPAAEKAQSVVKQRFPADSPAREFMELAGVTFAISMLLSFFCTLVFVFLPDFFPKYFPSGSAAHHAPFSVIAPMAALFFGLAVLAALFVLLALMAYLAAVYVYWEGGPETRQAVARWFPAELLPGAPEPAKSPSNPV